MADSDAQFAPAAAEGLPPSVVRSPASSDAESFEAALARVRPEPRHAPLRRLYERLRGRRAGRTSLSQRRRTAFDGYRNPLFDAKLERERRYGTVYTVKEERNAYLVTLELPRRLPISGLVESRHQCHEMPDYNLEVNLHGNVLTAKGSLPTEQLRRLSYISASLPANFMTRIEFGIRVDHYVYRVKNKNLEIIVFKK